MPSRSKKQDRLCEERNSQMSPLKDEWIRQITSELNQEHRIYYVKKRTTIDVICSLDHSEDTFYREIVDPYEGKKTMQQDPAHNNHGTCPICGKYGKFISRGRAKERDADIRYYTIWDEWTGGIVARHVEAGRRYYPDTECTEVEFDEYARTYLQIGESAQTDYRKYDYYGQLYFWDYKNVQSISPIKVKTGKEMNIMLLRRAPWKYAMDLNREAFGCDTLDFLKKYAEYPEIEIMYKCGMKKTARGFIYGCGARKYKSDKIWGKYGLSKEQWNYIRKNDSGVLFLRDVQKNNGLGLGCTIDQIEWFRNNMRQMPSKIIMDLTSPTKLIQYLEKQKVRENGYESIVEAYRHYEDYISTMQQMGYDLTNTVYLYPKNLRIKHDEAVHRLAVQQDQEKKQKKNEEYKNIAKNYKKICKKYAYEDGDFLIRPASSAGEIIEEGRELHHCVGGDNYLSSHSKGNSYILLMRHVKTPEIPFCTVEIKDSTIRQWYEANDKKPDKEIIQPWLDKYIKHLKEEEHGTNGTELAAG